MSRREITTFETPRHETPFAHIGKAHLVEGSSNVDSMRCLILNPVSGKGVLLSKNDLDRLKRSLSFKKGNRIITKLALNSQEDFDLFLSNASIFRKNFNKHDANAKQSQLKALGEIKKILKNALLAQLAPPQYAMNVMAAVS